MEYIYIAKYLDLQLNAHWSHTMNDKFGRILVPNCCFPQQNI